MRRSSPAAAPNRGVSRTGGETSVRGRNGTTASAFATRGFSQGGVDLWALIAATIAREESVAFTGHSLGGAMAQVLAACRNSDRRRKPCRVVTFGAPRVGSIRFGQLVRRSTEAVEYQREGDCVPDLPWPLYCWHPTEVRLIGRRLLDPQENHSLANYRADLTALGV
jgi:hypothetical protein